MSFVFAAKCADGVVVASDRRVILDHSILGTDQEKTFDLAHRIVVSGSTSSVGIWHEFAQGIKGMLEESRSSSIAEVVGHVNGLLQSLWERYRDVSPKDRPRLDVVLAGLDGLTSGVAKLYSLEAGGYSQQVSFLCYGHGGVYAHSLARAFWDARTSVDLSWRVAAFLISCTSRFHLSVGQLPDVFIIRNGTGILSRPLKV